MSKPMPEPVDVYLARTYKGALLAGSSPFPKIIPDFRDRSGPYEIVPGMMSLDELAGRGVFVQYLHGRKIWHIYPSPCADGEPCFNTAFEAQWAATCLVKKESKDDEQTK